MGRRKLQALRRDHLVYRLQASVAASGDSWCCQRIQGRGGRHTGAWRSRFMVGGLRRVDRTCVGHAHRSYAHSSEHCGRDCSVSIDLNDPFPRSSSLLWVDTSLSRHAVVVSFELVRGEPHNQASGPDAEAAV